MRTMWAAALTFFLFCAGMANAQPAGGSDVARSVASFEDPELDVVTSRELVRFESETELKAYARSLAKVVQARRRVWLGWQWHSRRARGTAQYAQLPEPPCLRPEDCPKSDAPEEVVVSASAAAAPSITNNQVTGVDEGDIVKQIGDFLLVLQDGRIFAIDTRGGGLRLADRADVYRDPKADTWYDEMLVQGQRIIVTAYSYGEQASEISVFRLDPSSGRLTREGVFLISSDDYYDVDNYATRVVGDRLVIYTPYAFDQFLGKPTLRPRLRRWLPEAERERLKRLGRPLFDARDIYRPVQRVGEPTLHAISICPLGRLRRGADLDCQTTTFLGPERAEMFVSPDHVFLWTTASDYYPDKACKGRPGRKDVPPAAVFRVPVRGGEPAVIGVNGAPFDQFSMDSRDGEFRALVDWSPFRCELDGPNEVSFLRAPERLFSNRLRPVEDGRFTETPSPGTGRVRNRFAEGWLAYGGRDRWGSYPPDDEDPPKSGKAVLVPVAQPKGAVVVDLPHDIIRIERLGSDLVVDGYRDASGLNVSLIRLQSAPRLAATLKLQHRYESEGRSHAFNARIDDDGGGLMGIPTVRRDLDAGRWWWRSDASDLSFISFSSSGALATAGELLEGQAETDESYRCEVSCVDWYGNSRPIFTGGRIFGLMETELVEARLVGGRVSEIRRLDLTQPPAPAK